MRQLWRPLKLSPFYTSRMLKLSGHGMECTRTLLLSPLHTSRMRKLSFHGIECTRTLRLGFDPSNLLAAPPAKTEAAATKAGPGPSARRLPRRQLK